MLCGTAHAITTCNTIGQRATLAAVPTSRPRHFVTETDDLTIALDAAAGRWPGLTRPQLLVRLALLGNQSVKRSEDEQRQRRLAAIGRHSGILTGAYGPDHLQSVRAEWPA